MQLLTYPNCQRANEAERVVAARLPGRFGPGFPSPKALRKLFEDLRLRLREKYLSGLASRVNPPVQVFFTFPLQVVLDLFRWSRRRLQSAWR